MLYKKDQAETLDRECFEMPGSEYRGAPFWAWNAGLDREELAEQIAIFQEMGFGGFHMHVRQGMEIPYLSEEFMEAVRYCTDEAKKRGMKACLYDEDRWPSGYAGGFITEHIRYRQRFLRMTKKDMESTEVSERAREEGIPYFVGAYDISINEYGEMTGYRRVERNEPGANKWYFFICTQPGGEPRYNLQSYVDVLSKEAIDAFIQRTYDAYEKKVGDEFGGTIPAIFTDEPSVLLRKLPMSGTSEEEAWLPWTMDFGDSYERQYGQRIEEALPELFFHIPFRDGNAVKYQYYRHVSERFAESYMDNIGRWCAGKGLMLTGHLMGEDTLDTASAYNGDVMRLYREMQLPGIDLLFDKDSFTTAKQCQSVVRQYGKAGMLSEMYGVTGWDFTLAGHKRQGDWQACLGVTVRVPHLSWLTMKGEGKRDYPASIFYQSPWYREYKQVEDHFARVNTAMTRGTAQVRTAVLHPIESFWLISGSRAETSVERREMEQHFKELAEWLLTGSVDFDYLAESLLEELCEAGGAPLRVGKMTYDTVIVEDCVTLRPHTIRILTEFRRQGGRLIFMGQLPCLSLGKPSEAARLLAESGEQLSHSKAALYRLLRDQHDVFLRDKNGYLTEHLLYQLRKDGEDLWLFVVNTEKPELPHITREQKITIDVKGIYEPFLYDTQNGEIHHISYENRNGVTRIYATVYTNTSLLIKLERREQEGAYLEGTPKKLLREITVSSETSFTLEEPNVLLLDMARFAVDGGALRETEEIMRVDEIVRQELGLTSRRSKVVQPWVLRDEPEDHTLKLQFCIESRIAYPKPLLALENPDKVSLTWNGESVENKDCGYYVDKYIRTVPLPPVRKGKNILEIVMPFGMRTDLENCYLLGSFGVTCVGRKAYITELPEKLSYGSVVPQGLAFYGGNIQYHTEIALEEASDVEMEISYFRGAMIKVLADGKEQGSILYAPFKLTIHDVEPGIHRFTYILYGNRYNTFSALHNLEADKKYVGITPDYWRSQGQKWAYEYQQRPMGILKTPIVRVK